MKYLNKELIKELFCFAIAGSVGFITDSLITLLLMRVCGPFIARIPAIFIAITVTWLINRKITFNHNTDKTILQEYLYYLATMIVGAAVNYTIYVIATKLLQHTLPSHWSAICAIIAGTAGGMVFNFLGSKFLIYNKKRECKDDIQDKA